MRFREAFYGQPDPRSGPRHRLIDQDFVLTNVLPVLSDAQQTHRWKVSGPHHVRASSARHVGALIFKARSSTWPMALCVKVFVPEEGRPANEALQEFVALQHRIKLSETAGYRSPRPLAFVSAANAIVMEWIGGWNAQGYLMATAAAPRLQRRCLEGAGRMLRALHNAEPVGWEPFRSLKLAKELAPRYHALLRSRRPSDSFEKIMRFAEFFISKAASFDQMPVPYAVLHDDFAPKNLIVTEFEVAAIDITTLHRGPVCRDVSEFLLYFDLFDPLGNLLGDTSLTTGQLRPFLAGYDPQWRDGAPAYVIFRYLFTTLRMWFDLIEWSLRNPRRLQRLAPLYAYRRLATIASDCESELRRLA